MSPRDLRSALLAAPVPDELEAQRRAWRVVKAAYAEREPVRRPRRLRLLVAVAVLIALLAAAISPPGRAVGDWIRDRVAGEEETQPALFRLPAAGQLLVVSEEGPWLVRPDGSKRLLGAYDDASFSPSARFVVATRGRRVVALEPDGDPRWSVTRPDPIADARWAPSPGFRVAYRAGETLRVVVGDGTGDRLLAENVAEIAPAWQPLEGRTVLAYADTAGRVHVTDADGQERWSAEPGAPPAKLVWSSDGRFLLVVTTGARHQLYGQGGRRAGVLRTPPAHSVLDAEFEPGTRRVAYSAFDGESGRGIVVLGEERLQRVEGRISDLQFSPDGRWLLAGWPEADQFLFLRLPGVRRIVAVDDVRREFDPGSPGIGEFPRISGWCCPTG
jgi:hypothetical protein